MIQVLEKNFFSSKMMQTAMIKTFSASSISISIFAIPRIFLYSYDCTDSGQNDKKN